MKELGSDMGFDALLDNSFGLDKRYCSNTVIRDFTTFKYLAMLVYACNQYEGVGLK